jgi:hypothetical protein
LGGNCCIDALSEVDEEASNVCEESFFSGSPSVGSWSSATGIAAGFGSVDTVHKGIGVSASCLASITDCVVNEEDKVSDDNGEDAEIEEVDGNLPEESGSFSGSLTTGKPSSSESASVDMLVASVIVSATHTIFSYTTRRHLHPRIKL